MAAMAAMATGGGIAAMVLNAWKGHLLTRRQREQLYVTGSTGEKKEVISMILWMIF